MKRIFYNCWHCKTFEPVKIYDNFDDMDEKVCCICGHSPTISNHLLECDHIVCFHCSEDEIKYMYCKIIEIPENIEYIPLIYRIHKLNLLVDINFREFVKHEEKNYLPKYLCKNIDIYLYILKKALFYHQQFVINYLDDEIDIFFKKTNNIVSWKTNIFEKTTEFALYSVYTSSVKKLTFPPTPTDINKLQIMKDKWKKNKILKN